MQTNTNERKNGRGIRVLYINILFIGVALITAVMMLLTSSKINRTFLLMRNATGKYIKFQQEVSEMTSVSDFLTDQARAFAATHEIGYLNGYFEEVEVTKKRDVIIEDLEAELAGTAAYQHLQSALKDSVYLEQQEYYSMRLVADAYGIDEGSLPGTLREIKLSEADARLSAAEKAAMGNSLLYDSDYVQQKNNIYNNIDLCTDDLLDTLMAEQSETSSSLEALIARNNMLLTVFIVIVLANAVLDSVMIIFPLMKAAERVSRQELIPERGAYEVRSMARIFNSIFEESNKAKVKLSYEASHDALTGLLNRRAFEDVLGSSDHSSIALVIVDVDYFKQFNDRYGHDVGDAVLKRVASVLRESFRSEDAVCRIGGDEFALVLMRMGKDLRPLVEGKLTKAREILSRADNGVPEITLSIGVAFGDRDGATDDIFKDADTAMYRVKQRGKNGIEFY